MKSVAQLAAACPDLDVQWFPRKASGQPKYNFTVTALLFDSRTCVSDSAFFAFPGFRTNGSSYIDEAITLGAKLIICENEPLLPHEGIQYLITPQVRVIYSRFCAAWFDFPAKSLDIIGVTGTDGKTSTADFIYQLFSQFSLRAGLLSTVSKDDGSILTPSPYRQSTPEAFEIHSFLASCKTNGLKTVVLEATSHGLSDYFSRLKDIVFTGAVYTSITSEHLEFHKTIEAYVDAKLNLARQLKPDGLLIIAQDNPWKNVIASVALMQPEFYHLPEHNYGFSAGPSIFLKNASGAALLAQKYLNIPASQVLAKLSALRPVPGRYELLPSAFGATFLIDFAHTEDAFSKLLPSIKPSHGRLIVLFGSAGRRDLHKRPAMGAVASRYADIIILTDEDPRDEDPLEIIHAILEGMDEPQKALLIPNRRHAIERAVALASPGDVIALLGKGHESTIEYAHHSIAWNEKSITLDIIEERASHEHII